MKIGTVKWFNARKGYGFLKPVDGGFDVYVHISALEAAGLTDLKEGQKIRFDLGSDARTGEIFAENLRLLNSATPIAPDDAVEPISPPAPGTLAGFLARRRASPRLG